MSQTLQHVQLPSAILLRWVWSRYLRPQLPRLIGATFFMSVQGAMLGVISYLIRPIFDDVFAQGDQNALIYVGLGVFAVFVIRGLSGFIQRVMMASVGERMKYDLQRDLVNRIIALDKKFFEDNPAGDIIQRIKNDLSAIQSVWQGLFAPGVRDLISVGSLFVVAVSIDWLWTTIALAGIPLLTLPVLAVQKITRKYSLRAAIAHAEIIIRLEEMLHNIREIKLYRAEESQKQKFMNVALVVKKASVRTEAAVASVPLLVEFVAGIGFLGILVFAGTDVINGDRTIGQFMSFFTAVVLLFDPVKRLGNLFSSWQSVKVSLERVYAVFQSNSTILSPLSPTKLPENRNGFSVKFENVGLELGGHTVIDNLSFTAKTGEITAIVGPSGAGKTSVFNLLSRIIDSDRGTIWIEDRNIKYIELSQLRDSIAFVSQDSGIFDESIRSNIRFGNLNADGDAFEHVVKAARVHDFALREKEGYDARCGPRGELLSGGQKQRVAIARALLKDAPILLLDEPTSALDLESESLVQQAVYELAKDRTVIVIAHRLSTIQNADKIIFLQAGNLAEQGTHNELMKKNGLYASLFRIQFSTKE